MIIVNLLAFTMLLLCGSAMAFRLGNKSGYLLLAIALVIGVYLVQHWIEVSAMLRLPAPPAGEGRL